MPLPSALELARMSEAQKPVKVYYNGACPVCNASISNQRARMEACGLRAEWFDIHANPQVLKELGLGQEEARKKLHVIDATGSIRVGADAFATLWRQTPGQGLLGHVIALPVFRVLARAGYNLFAAALYRWNKAKGRW